MHYVTHVGGSPTVRTYDVRGWKLKTNKLSLDLAARDEGPPLRLGGKLSGKQLDLGLVRRKGARPETLLMSREDRFLTDLELIRGVND